MCGEIQVNACKWDLSNTYGFDDVRFLLHLIFRLLNYINIKPARTICASRNNG